LREIESMNLVFIRVEVLHTTGLRLLSAFFALAQWAFAACEISFFAAALSRLLPRLPLAGLRPTRLSAQARSF
jgi:hypothetical protein